MAAERLGVTYFQDLASHCSDPQLREMCLQLARQSFQHFERLLGILNRSDGGHGTFQVGQSASSWHTHSGVSTPALSSGTVQPAPGYTH